MAKIDLDKELFALIEKLKPSLDVFAKIVLSLEANFEHIVDLLVENEKQEMDMGDLTDDEIKKELKEVTDELKEHFRKNKVIGKRLMDKLGLQFNKEDNVRTKTKKDLETVMRLMNTLIETLISEIVAELEVLQDEYKFENDEKTAAQIKSLVSDLEELTERSFDVSGIIEAEFDIEIDDDLDKELEEEIEKSKKKNSTRPDIGFDFSR